MVERRTISDAVDLTPKLEAFIKTGIPPAPTQPMRPSEPASATSVPSETVVDMPTSTGGSTRLRTRSRRTPRRADVNEGGEAESQTASLLGEMLVPLTTKLRRKTVHSLRRAYLEQKLNGQTPATQQEIIEEAVHEWLSRNGFLTA
jgi:hypothetical protein